MSVSWVDVREAARSTLRAEETTKRQRDAPASSTFCDSSSSISALIEASLGGEMASGRVRMHGGILCGIKFHVSRANHAYRSLSSAWMFEGFTTMAMSIPMQRKR